MIKGDARIAAIAHAMLLDDADTVANYNEQQLALYCAAWEFEVQTRGLM